MLPSIFFYTLCCAKKSNHNAFYKFVSVHQYICVLFHQKWIAIDFLKKHYTCSELFEDDDNEVFKLLKDGYSSSEASSSESEGISDNDSNELFSSDEDSLRGVPNTIQKVTKTSALINM